MKSLNVKRIAAIVAGATMLGIGAFAGNLTFQNVPIITASGQPVVQVVIGSHAQPSDGVAAGNIAAAIGNLAFSTPVPVTATVNATQAAKVLKATVSGSSGYTIANQQVYLNQSGTSIASGSYGFTALIGSVLNGAVVLGTPQFTKALQGSGQYTFPESHATSISPVASPYTAAGFVPGSGPNANSNGGGITFSGFTSSSNDNIMQITPAQYSGLANNWGAVGETENLWFTGFPVYDQQYNNNAGSFAVVSAGGAYQATFSSPISNSLANNNLNINVPIKLLGTNYTILNASSPSGTLTTATNTVGGGSLYLAQAATNLQTIYVGQNLTSGPVTVQLQDLGQPNSNGISQAALQVYYNGVATNKTSVSPGVTQLFNISGHRVYVRVNSTFAGLYLYQKWAKLQIFSNVQKVTDAQVYNQTTNPGWYARLLWTNTTSGTKPKELQSIVLYNATPVTTLLPGQSFNYIQSPQTFKISFVGDTLGSGNYDAVTFAASTVSSVNYQNTGTSGSVGGTSHSTAAPTNITEPAQELTVTSQIPNAFTFAGQTGSQVVYDLSAYQLNINQNSIVANDPNGGAPANGVNVIILDNSFGAANFITSTNPLTVQITGYTSNVATSAQTQSVTFTSNNANVALSTSFYNISNIQINRAIPGGPFSITVEDNSLATLGVNSMAVLANVPATLASGAPIVYGPLSGKVYYSVATNANVVYNQQNGNPTSTFYLKPTFDTTGAGAGGVAMQQYYSYSMNEIAVSANTVAQDNVAFGIVNSSSGYQATPGFQLNYTASSTNTVSQRNNVSYTGSTTVTTINARQGFRTERGSSVAAITPTQLTINFAKNIDTLQFAVSSAATTVATSSHKTYGPYGIGQAVSIPGVSNVTVAKVTANVTVGPGATYTVSGIGNLTATATPSSYSQPADLKTLLTGSNPLVVLDTQAQSAPLSAYVLVGSGYVNSMSKLLEQGANISVTPSSAPMLATYTGTASTGPRIYVAGYSANQTMTEADAFIQQLYQLAGE
ncbi:MAG: hypothetical protein KGH98_01235 [Candidatus Micrarchaeota archaeon]|nr:hypothetical protein [Candidatus Micrarchaeota archaeon]